MIFAIFISKGMNQRRKQLTLFVDEPQSKAIEKIRLTFNLKQYALIKSHVTLCREDELERLAPILDNLLALDHGPIAMPLGPMKRFAEGKGVLIPISGNATSFHKLRAEILAGVVDIPRRQDPHITLMHPRNSICTDSIFETIKSYSLPVTLLFTKVSLIEQEIGKKWHTLREFELVNDKPQ